MTLKRFVCTILLACLLVLGVSLTSAQSFETNESYLMRYFALLNQNDYQTAYAMIESPTQTYTNFVAEFATTTRIVPYFGFTGVATGHQYVTTVLLSYQNDGTVKSYYGVFHMTSGANYEPSRNNGGPILMGSEFRLVKDGEALHTTSIQTLLDGPYDVNRDIPQDIPHLSDMSNPWTAGVLLPYYDLINRGDFAGAYAEWLTPQHGLTRDYRLSYQQFVTGYTDTDYVTVYVGYTQAVLASQSPFSSYVPTVMISQHIDGTFTTYSGCYAIGMLPNTHYGIANGRFTVLANGVVNAERVFEALNTLNCAALGINA